MLQTDQQLKSFQLNDMFSNCKKTLPQTPSDHTRQSEMPGFSKTPPPAQPTPLSEAPAGTAYFTIEVLLRAFQAEEQWRDWTRERGEEETMDPRFDCKYDYFSQIKI